jgi:hypothetical protein
MQKAPVAVHHRSANLIPGDETKNGLSRFEQKTVSTTQNNRLTGKAPYKSSTNPDVGDVAGAMGDPMVASSSVSPGRIDKILEEVPSFAPAYIELWQPATGIWAGSTRPPRRGDAKLARQPEPGFDDRQAPVYRAPSQAGPGNDINAWSPGFHKAPTRGPASLVAIPLYPAGARLWRPAGRPYV